MTDSVSFKKLICPLDKPVGDPKSNLIWRNNALYCFPELHSEQLVNLESSAITPPTPELSETSTAKVAELLTIRQMIRVLKANKEFYSPSEYMQLLKEISNKVRALRPSRRTGESSDDDETEVESTDETEVESTSEAEDLDEVKVEDLCESVSDSDGLSDSESVSDQSYEYVELEFEDEEISSLELESEYEYYYTTDSEYETVSEYETASEYDLASESTEVEMEVEYEEIYCDDLSESCELGRFDCETAESSETSDVEFNDTVEVDETTESVDETVMAVENVSLLSIISESESFSVEYSDTEPDIRFGCPAGHIGSIEDSEQLIDLISKSESDQFQFVVQSVIENAFRMTIEPLENNHIENTVDNQPVIFTPEELTPLLHKPYASVIKSSTCLPRFIRGCRPLPPIPEEISESSETSDTYFELTSRGLNDPALPELPKLIEISELSESPLYESNSPLSVPLEELICPRDKPVGDPVHPDLVPLEELICPQDKPVGDLQSLSNPSTIHSTEPSRAIFSNYLYPISCDFQHIQDDFQPIRSGTYQIPPPPLELPVLITYPDGSSKYVKPLHYIPSIPKPVGDPKAHIYEIVIASTPLSPLARMSSSNSESRSLKSAFSDDTSDSISESSEFSSSRGLSDESLVGLRPTGLSEGQTDLSFGQTHGESTSESTNYTSDSESTPDSTSESSTNYTSKSESTESESETDGFIDRMQTPSIDWMIEIVKEHPVLTRFLKRLWQQDTVAMMRFFSIASLYFSMITLLDERLRLDHDRCFLTLTEFYLKQIELEIIGTNGRDEAILFKVIECLSDLSKYGLNELGDHEITRQFEVYLKLINSLVEQLSVIVDLATN